jgi:hypothetical protein
MVAPKASQHQFAVGPRFMRIAGFAAAGCTALLMVAAACASPVPPTPSEPNPSNVMDTPEPTSAPTLTPTPAALAVGDTAVTCVAVDLGVCDDVARLAITNLGRGLPPRAVTVEARPDCPTVPDWADGSFCWEATFYGSSCLVIARRPTLGGYGQVGGPIAGRAGSPPADWPRCS